MANDPNAKTVALSIRLQCADVQAVRQSYGAEFQSLGLFVPTKAPRPIGTSLRLQLRLTDGAPLFTVTALVVESARKGGMQLRFTAADRAARNLLTSLGTERLPPLLEETPTASLRAKKPEGPMIGIDLGTTNSAAAFVANGKPFVLPSREGYNTVPSIIALTDKGRLIIGHSAKGQMLTNPRRTVYGAKRLIGRAYASPIVEQLRHRFQYPIVEGPRGEVAVQLGDNVYSLQEISAMVLREVKGIAQNHLGCPVERAVITVPAYYNDNQRQAVREAGALAGLHVERILNEPTAAALAFGYGRKLEERVLVFDLGGGTFDVSVLELHPENVYEVVSTGGDTFLGGVDFDNEIVSFLLESFRSHHGIEFPGDRVAFSRVVDAAENAKITLSEQKEVRILVPFVALVDGKPYDLDVLMTRQKLEDLTAHLVDRCIQKCTEVLASRKLAVTDINEVLLVGGQSRMPYVRQRIHDYFGREPSRAVHPDEAVALGAATLADALAGASNADKAVLLIDVLPMSIGLGLPNGKFQKLIERNTTLPQTCTTTVATQSDGQAAIDVLVFQGENPRCLDNEYLGRLHFGDLPEAPRGAAAVEVTFRLSAECLLSVSAREKLTGREEHVTLSTRDTPELVKELLAAAGVEDGALEDRTPRGVAAFFKRVFG